MNNDQEILKKDAIGLLKRLIEIPSFSREENGTASVLEEFFTSKDIKPLRCGNNIYTIGQDYDLKKPSILLNSHHDTVKPNKGYTNDPFKAIEKDGKLFGLGSNDAGASLVALIATFLFYYQKPSKNYNLVFAATAEEEISGTGGIEMLLQDEGFRKYTCEQFVGAGNDNKCFALVGEPTQMHMAVAERGLLVLDCLALGRAGHAAREEGENAIYKAIKDIEWFSTYRFDRVSELLGPVKMSVTVIDTENKAHNVVPSQCRFVVDARINELYSFEEVLETIYSNVNCEIKPRSLRMRSTSIPVDHPIVKAGIELGRGYYGSPTTSDKALMPFPSLKIGPGDSARSHTADEFIYTDEIEKGIELYIKLLNQLL